MLIYVKIYLKANLIRETKPFREIMLTPYQILNVK